MPFVNEKISAEDKARINWKPFRIVYPAFWTIDRDRDAFLVRITLGRPAPDDQSPKYILSWRGEIITAHVTGFWERRPGEYEITSVLIPPCLEMQRANILDVLKEAIIAHGDNYDGAGMSAVHISNNVHLP